MPDFQKKTQLQRLQRHKIKMHVHSWFDFFPAYVCWRGSRLSREIPHKKVSATSFNNLRTLTLTPGPWRIAWRKQCPTVPQDHQESRNPPKGDGNGGNDQPLCGHGYSISIYCISMPIYLCTNDI